MASKYLYSVCHGPDSRHLIECKIFTLKRDAKHFIESLDTNRAIKFERLYFPKRWTPCTEKLVLYEKII